jgi:hypothetical protein
MARLTSFVKHAKPFAVAGLLDTGAGGTEEPA